MSTSVNKLIGSSLYSQSPIPSLTVVNTKRIEVVNNKMSRKWGKQHNWPTISTRIDPLLKQKLLQKHPIEGEVSLVLRKLIELYLNGRIIGVRVEKI